MIEAIRSGFVAVAASDVDYANHADQTNFEVRWLRQVLANAKHGLFQGIYVATPAGELLGQVDGGWPVYDPNVTVRALAQAKQRYESLPRERRLLASPPDRELDRAWPVHVDAPPDGYQRLNATKRTRPFAGMSLEDVRHPQHLHLDAVDVRSTWLAGLVPTRREVGATARADTALLFAMAEESVMQPECSVWREDEFTARELNATIERIDGRRVALTMTGRMALAARNEWNRGASYDGRIGGRAVWLDDEQRFESFELVLLGTHTLRASERHNRKGSPTCDVAVHLVLEETRPVASVPSAR